MTPETAARIAAIAGDRLSGAAELALRAAEALALASGEAQRPPPAASPFCASSLKELAEAAQAIMRAQPSMAPVYNAARAALDGRLAEFTARLERSSEVIARAAASLLRGRVVLTHSYSSTVLDALREGAPARVICTESLPGGEGARMAEALEGEVIPDSAVCAALAGVDVVMVGADALTPEHVINKIGTAAVALCARERGVPCWVLCATAKFAEPGWQPALGELFEATPRCWFSGVIDDG